VGGIGDGSGVSGEAGAALRRIATALRTMSPGKLAMPLPGPTPTRADAGRMLARTLLIAAQGIEDAEAPTIPTWRALPEVADLVVGDQVNVLAHDFERAVAARLVAGDESASAKAEVWTRDGRAPLADVVRDVSATADEVRRLL
jgi:hypothetical protein